MNWINDPVNSPNHYTRSHPGMECIELTADTSFCLGTTIKLGDIETDKTGNTIYSAHRSLTQDDMYRDTATLALLRWITHLEQFSQITNQTKEDA